MKKSIFYLSFLMAIVMYSCNSQEEAWPEDIEGKRTLLQEKKAHLEELRAEIAQLNEEIDKMAPITEKEAVLVNVEKVEKEAFQSFTTVQGSVQSDDEVMVSSEIGGRLLQLNVSEGDYVSRGKLIAKVDVEGVQSQIAEIQTQLDLAQNIYERQKKLWDQNIGSEVQYLQAKNNVERLEKSIASARTQLNKSNVYAPISGFVDMEMVKQGEVVAPGTPIVQLLNTSKVKVVADVPESYLGSVKRGDPVTVTFPALGEEMKETISMLGRTIDPSNRTFKIEVDVNNKSGLLKPNLLAEIKFMDFEDKEAITVPVNVVLEEVDGSKYVYTVKKEGDQLFTQKNPVDVGRSTGDVIMIESGLDLGDSVIVKGARLVSLGDPVIVAK